MKKYKVTISVEEEINDSILSLIEKNLDLRSGNRRIPFILNRNQERILEAIENHHNNIIMKDRRIGANSIINAIIACRLVSSDPWNILTINKNSDLGNFNLSEVRRYVDIILANIGLDITYVKDNINTITLSNGNTLHTISNNCHCMTLNMCQYVPFSNDRRVWVILDEYAFFKSQEDIFEAIRATFCHSKLDMTIISGQNGYDSFFMPFYIACSKLDNWNRLQCEWILSDHLSDAIINIRETLGDCQFMYEFGGRFILKKEQNIMAEDLIMRINKFLPKDKAFSLLDLVELYESKLISII